MAIAAKKANTMWCSARVNVRFIGLNQLSALFWQYVMAHAYVLSAEDSRVATMCTIGQQQLYLNGTICNLLINSS